MVFIGLLQNQVMLIEHYNQIHLYLYLTISCNVLTNNLILNISLFQDMTQLSQELCSILIFQIVNVFGRNTQNKQSPILIVKTIHVLRQI